MRFIRLPHKARPVFMVTAGAILGAVLTAAAPQVSTALDRPPCAERLMQAVSTDKTVSGTYECFDRQLQAGLLQLGVSSDGTFAQRVGQNGDYRFLHKTADGGYVYEYDRPTTPHDRIGGAIDALALARMRGDLRGWNLPAVWREMGNLRLAWAEITGKTQNDESHLYTIYMGTDGKIKGVK